MFKERVDPQTMVCKAHDVEACIVCMTDEFYDWIDNQKAKRQQYKAEWRATPVTERFDLGGEN